MGEIVSEKRFLYLFASAVCFFFLVGCGTLVKERPLEVSEPSLQIKKERLRELQDKKYRVVHQYSDFWRSAEEKEKLRVELSDLNKKIESAQHDIDMETQQSNKSCFPAETKVLLANSEFKPISAIKVGDSLMTYDIARDVLTNSPVKHIYISDNNHYYMLNDKLQATAYERLLTGSGWKIIRDIAVGENVFNGNMYEPVTSIEVKNTDLTVYNLNVETSHNFFVSLDGENPLLVHNSGGGGGGGGGGGK